jgi:predicted XRE-type DNA-binding protein
MRYIRNPSCSKIGDVGSPDTPVDPVINALDNLVEALSRNIEASELAMRRARTIKELRARGLEYRVIADETGEPLVVQLVTENLDRLRVYGAQLRHAHAAALHDEGLTMDQIAELFGVTRQRISALLRSGRED